MKKATLYHLPHVASAATLYCMRYILSIPVTGSEFGRTSLNSHSIWIAYALGSLLRSYIQGLALPLAVQQSTSFLPTWFPERPGSPDVDNMYIHLFCLLFIYLLIYIFNILIIYIFCSVKNNVFLLIVRR